MDTSDSTLANDERIERLVDSLEELLDFVPPSDRPVLQSAVGNADVIFTLGDMTLDFMALASALIHAITVTGATLAAPGGGAAAPTPSGTASNLLHLSTDDLDAFTVEINGVLKDLGFPLESFSLNHSNPWPLAAFKIYVIEYLAVELQAIRLISSRASATQSTLSASESTPAAQPMDTSSDENAGPALASIAFTLQLPVDTAALERNASGTFELASSAVASILSDATRKVTTTLAELPADYIGERLLRKELSTEQMAKLAAINKELEEEYALRRRMLLKRLDVTIQSFEWSSKAKAKIDAVQRAFQTQRASLLASSPVDLYSVLAATTDLLKISRASSESARRKTQSTLYNVLMGKVPDRGGRPKDARGARMPAFKKRDSGSGGSASASGSTSSGSGGGQGHGKGGRVQGGWADSSHKGKGRAGRR